MIVIVKHTRQFLIFRLLFRKQQSSIDFFQQELFSDDSNRIQQQLALVRAKEKLLTEKTAAELSKIHEKRTQILQLDINADNIRDKTVIDSVNEKIQKLKEREEKVRKRHDQRSKELRNLKNTLKQAEKARKRIVDQHQKESRNDKSKSKQAIQAKKDFEYSDTSTSVSISIPKDKNLNKRSKSKSSSKSREKEKKNQNNGKRERLSGNENKMDEGLITDDALDETLDSTTQENPATKDIPDSKGRETAPSPTSRKENLKKKIGNNVSTLKAPLSPKSSRKFGSSLSNISFATNLSTPRKRHSSAGSSTDESLSISQADTVSSDHSGDMEIRISTLQEELRKRVMTANKLKRQQKVKRREKLKLQEEALKKQIEAYDNLIVKTKADLEESINSTSSLVIVQPQIKTPKVRTMICQLVLIFRLKFKMIGMSNNIEK